MNPQSSGSNFDKTTFILLVLVATLCLVPFFAQKYAVILITEILIFGLLATSLDLCLGYTGLASLGHAAFFGAGAYTVGILVAKAQFTSVFLAVPSALLVSAVVALIVGFFSLRTVGIYFLMITLAFGQMAFAFVHKWKEVTGGSDGISLGKRPVIDLLTPYLTIDFGNYQHFYFIVLGSVILCLVALRRLVRLRIGEVAIGIKENEMRVKFMGFNTFGYKLAVFVISGIFAGFSGVLHVLQRIYIT